MSSTSQLNTFLDLYTDLLQRVRVSTSVAATTEQAKRYINIALNDVHLGTDYKLPWSERQSVLRTRNPYITGTLTATRGSEILVGSGTSWGSLNEFGIANIGTNSKVFIQGNSEIYKIQSVDSTTQITLTTKYIGDTGSSLTYTLYDDTYSLDADFVRPVNLYQFSPAYKIPLLSRTEFRRKYINSSTSGKPCFACLIDEGASGTVDTPVRRVVLFPYPDKTYLIPYTYISSTLAVSSSGAPLTNMVSDTDTPIMPLRYRHAILFHALSHWYRDRKDDARSESAKSDYVDIMTRILNDQDIATHTTAQIQPGIGQYHQYARTPYQNRGGRKVFDLNDDFDRLRR